MLTNFQNFVTIILCSKFAVSKELNKFPTIIYTRPHTTLQNFCAQKIVNYIAQKKGVTRFVCIFQIILHLIS